MKNLDLSMMLLLIRIASATCWEMHLKNKAKQNVSLNHVLQNKSLFFCDFGYLSVHRLCLYNNLWRWLSWTWNRNISDEFCMVLQYEFFPRKWDFFFLCLFAWYVLRRLLRQSNARIRQMLNRMIRRLLTAVETSSLIVAQVN